jgi:hypothetical protein
MILEAFLEINRYVTLRKRSLRPKGLRRFAARFPLARLMKGFATLRLT